MSFYVTLPSNSSSTVKNTQANFTTYLNDPLILNGKYEVALSEICFSGGFRVPLGTLKFTNPFFKIFEHRSEFFEFDLTIINGISIEEFADKLNEKIRETIVKREFTDLYTLIYYDLPDSVLENIKILNSKKISVMKRNLKPYLEIYCTLRLETGEQNYMIFDFEESPFKESYINAGGKCESNKWIFLNRNFKEHLEAVFELNFQECPPVLKNSFEEKNKDINIATKLQAMKQFFLEKYASKTIPYFGVNNNVLEIIMNSSSLVDCTSFFKTMFFKDQEFHIISTNRRFRLETRIDIINYIFLYTNIIEDQYYGQQKAQILRVIPINASKDKKIETFYENPHYASVKETLINSINIEIRDIFGKPIQFSDFFSYVIVKLHFKKQIK